MISGILHVPKTGGRRRDVPAALALTPGNTADITMAIPLLGVATSLRRLIADKACAADSLRRWLAGRRINAGIPSTASRRTPPAISPAAPPSQRGSNESPT